jgi:hypothetical protein
MSFRVLRSFRNCRVVGLHPSVPLIGGFLLVCIAEGVAGWLLWSAHKSGAVLALALLPFGAAFWWGLSLPLGPLLALVRTLLILAVWNRLR